jgi:hypothetical protein
MRTAAPFRAAAPALRDRRPLPPGDRAVPQLADLLDRDAMRSVLERSLRAGSGIDGLRVILVDYRPGCGAVVGYEARVGGVSHVAVATAGPGRTLLYRPGRRAVLRAGDVVLKAYADDAAFRAGVNGLRVAGGLRLEGGPRVHGALGELRLTVQTAIDGVPVPRSHAGAVAPVAGSMLRALHDARVPGLAPAPPERLLALAARAAAVAAAVAPHLERRARDLVARLEEHAPRAGALVPSHGDFNVSQLLDVGGALAAVDFDEACRAAPALDVASYAANLVGGRPGDLRRAAAALAALLDGYGARPADLAWYLSASLLRRAPSPFRLQKRRWPERMAAILGAAEEVLGR